MSKLIAVHSIQTYDEKRKQVVDIRPGQEFEAATAKEAGELIAAGAARQKTDADKTVAAKSSADGLPTPPSGYAAGTVGFGGVVADPNAAVDEVDTGKANTDTAKGEAAKGESSTKSSGSRR